MRPNPQETADLLTFTEEILNGKLHFLCCVFFSIFMISVKPFNNENINDKLKGVANTNIIFTCVFTKCYIYI